MDNRRTFRISDEDYAKLQQQAARMGLNSSEYIRLIITLDVSTEIIKKLKAAEK
jgi:predicted DNA binding CopG/RHH family protein